MIPYPVSPDPMFKFKKSGETHAFGTPILDSATLMSGEPCCSGCRKKMALVDGVWVHA